MAERRWDCEAVIAAALGEGSEPTRRDWNRAKLVTKALEAAGLLASGGSGEVPAGLTREALEFLQEVVGTAAASRRHRAFELGVTHWLCAALRGPGEPPEGSGGKR